MKANEAPNKIYLNPLLMEDGESIVRRCSFERQRDSQIEYARTDVLVRKACEYLRNTKRCVVECIGENVYKPLLSEGEIMEFCKSMKGE